MADRRPIVVNLARLFDREPPKSLDAEACLIGSMLLDPEVVGDVAELVAPAAYASRAHEAIAAAIYADDAKHPGRLDIVAVVEAMRQDGTLDLAGGEDYLVELGSAVPSAAAWTRYAEIVRLHAQRRELIRAMGEAIYRAYEEPTSGLAPEQIADRLEQIAQDVAAACRGVGRERDGLAGDEPMAGVIGRVLDRARGIHAGTYESPAVSTGLADLDDAMEGLMPGQVLVIGARPSMGKSALGVQMAMEAAKRGERAAVLNLEMTDESMADRLIASQVRAGSAVGLRELRRGAIDDRGLGDVEIAAEALIELPLELHDMSAGGALRSAEIDAVVAWMRRAARRRGVGVFVLDYLQLMRDTSVGQGNKVAEVSSISTKIKRATVELGARTVLLSQLNREAERRADGKPSMADLRDSGSIEQDADAIVLIHNAYLHRTRIGDEDWLLDHAEAKHEAELMLVKQRHGETGSVRVAWNGARARFGDRVHNRPEAMTSYGPAVSKPPFTPNGPPRRPPPGAFRAGE